MDVQRQGVLVPPNKQATYLFIDDLNMGKVNDQCFEAIREVKENGGWHSRMMPYFK